MKPSGAGVPIDVSCHRILLMILNIWLKWLQTQRTCYRKKQTVKIG
jgi:hypothetical protein